MSDDLVKRLREVSLEKHQEAWGRLDGGQDLTIGAVLAEEAADRIEELEAKLAKAVEFISNLKQYAVAIDDRHLHDKAVSTLAELTGGKDE